MKPEEYQRRLTIVKNEMNLIEEMNDQTEFKKKLKLLVKEQNKPKFLDYTLVLNIILTVCGIIVLGEIIRTLFSS